MDKLTFSDYVLIGVLVMFAAGKIARILKWDRGALIADELGAALGEARGFIVDARAAGSKGSAATVNIDRACEAAAARVKGLNSADVKPLVESLVSSSRGSRYGVEFSLDEEGNVRVDPSGFAAKAAHKAGKWLKKVF